MKKATDTVKRVTRKKRQPSNPKEDQDTSEKEGKTKGGKEKGQGAEASCSSKDKGQLQGNEVLTGPDQDTSEKEGKTKGGKEKGQGAAPDISNDTREQTQGGEEVVQVAGAAPYDSTKEAQRNTKEAWSAAEKAPNTSLKRKRTDVNEQTKSASFKIHIWTGRKTIQGPHSRIEILNRVVATIGDTQVGSDGVVDTEMSEGTPQDTQDSQAERQEILDTGVQHEEVEPVASAGLPLAGRTGSVEEAGVGNDVVPNTQEVLKFIALKCLTRVDGSEPEEFNEFLRYLEDKHNVLVVNAEPGSLTLTAPSLGILDGLWYDCCTGNLNDMAQKYLVTKDVLKKFGLTELKLTTTIQGEEYIAARNFFLQGSEKAQKTSLKRKTTDRNEQRKPFEAEIRMYIDYETVPDPHPQLETSRTMVIASQGTQTVGDVVAVTRMSEETPQDTQDSQEGSQEMLDIGVQHEEVEPVASAGLPLAERAGSVEEASVGNNVVPKTQDVMHSLAMKYHPNYENLDHFIQKLEEVRNLLVVKAEPGSVIFTALCSSLEILDALWFDYCTGNLNDMAQKYLVTKDVLKKFGLTELKLTTTIQGEEYIAARKLFLRGSEKAPSTSLKSDTTDGNEQTKSVQGCLDQITQVLQQMQLIERKKYGKVSGLINNASDRGFTISDKDESGNCMFYALSEQLVIVKGIKIRHGELRQRLVQYLRDNPKLPDGTDLFHFVHEHQTWTEYLVHMEQDGAWGDHLILYAAASHFDTCIRVVSSLSHRNDVIITPRCLLDESKPLVLGHIHELYYVSLQPVQGSSGRPLQSL